MNIAYKTLFAGMLAMVFCGTAVAHDRGHGDWSGGVSVIVGPHGELAWSGGLNYGPVVTHAPRYVRVPAPYRGPVCGHPSHRHPVVHHHGHKHWRKHWKRHHRHHHYH